MKTFAAIDIGSYELAMKIYEISGKGTIKEIDYIRKRIELGSDTYNTGKISLERVDELCNALLEFKTIMKGYKVDDLRVYGTSAIRETKNTLIVTEQIKLRTGFEVEVLSNSEQRFLHSKAVASRGERFDELIKDGAAIVDIGGGSIQVSLYEDSHLKTTQNIRLGILRIREILAHLEARTTDYASLVSELVDNHFHYFKELYLSKTKISSVIVVDDYISHIIQRAFGKEIVSTEEYRKFIKEVKEEKPSDLAKKYGLSGEYASLLVPSAILIRKLVKLADAVTIWAPGVSLADGMAFDYAQNEKLIKNRHDFEDDVVYCATEVAKRYKSNVERCRLVEKIALKLFDETKKIHGLTKRDRLLLRIAAILSECGKYMSLEDAAECSYVIIMATEMIGITHAEREIVANIVKFNKVDFEYYGEMGKKSLMTAESYITMAKLTAIFRLADGVCRSYRTKVNDVKVSIKDSNLVINADCDESLILERGFFERKAGLFEEEFTIKPVLVHKKNRG
ncbi:MAG: exopolyphosphatase [Lachnospiraceae bacterium]|nr:exopolyphosphatase [Lachnospiraceae bacterium]